MAQETIPVQGLGTSAAPLTYPVAVGDSFDLMAAFASFDGSGAGGAWVPAIQVLAPSGAIMVQTIGSSVAAGGSADVTFAPFLEAAQTSVTPSFAGLPFASGIRFAQSLPDNAETQINLTHNSGTADFVTSDNTIFDLDTTSGTGEMGILVDGTYLVHCWATLLSVAAPAAGSIGHVTTGSDISAGTRQAYSPWFQQIGGVNYNSFPSFTTITTFKAGEGLTPTAEPLVVGQKTGGAVTATSTGITVIQLSPVGYF